MTSTPMSDEVWADRARLGLLREDATVESVEAAVEEALAAAREAGEPAVVAHGDPRAWADDHLEEWRVTGAEAFDAPPALTTRAALVASPATAAVLAILMAFVTVMEDGLGARVPAGMAAVPPLLAAATLLTGAAWDRLRHALPFPRAVAATLAVAALAVGLVVAGIWALRAVTWSGPWTWLLVEAGALAVLTPLLHRLLPASRPRTVATGRAMSDDQWRTAFVSAARGRGDRTEVQIQDTLREAVTHAAASGSTLVGEFGRPDAYARALPGDPHRSAVRRFRYLAALLTLMTFLLLARILDGWTWGFGSIITLVTFALMAVITVRARRQVRHTRGG